MMTHRDQRDPAQAAGEKLLVFVLLAGGLLMATACSASGLLLLANWLGR